MDREEMLDWELVHGSDSDSITSEKESGSLSVIDDGMIVSDHFSTDHLVNDQSLGFGDSSRVCYGTEPLNPVDSAFDQLDVYQSGDGLVRNELGFTDDEIKVNDFQASDENIVEGKAVSNESHIEDLSKCLSKTDNLQVERQTGVEEHSEDKVNDFQASDESIVEGKAVSSESHIEDLSKCLSKTDKLQVESQTGVEEHSEDLSKSFSESGINELVSRDSGIVNVEEEIVSDSESVEGSGGDPVDVAPVVAAVRSGNEGESIETVWWKMPLVLVKYYAHRIGPFWSVSMAAAVMGFVLLGRRLYNMKKQAQRFHLKVAIDEKKVSQVMSQAARLNEAFTEVRRVPVIRPSLPSSGAWPVLSLR